MVIKDEFVVVEELNWVEAITIFILYVNSMLLTTDKSPVDKLRLRGELAVYYTPVDKYKV